MLVPAEQTPPPYLHARDVTAVPCVHTDGIAFLDEIRAPALPHPISSLNFLGDTCGSISAYRDLCKDDFQVHTEGQFHVQCFPL